MPGHCLLGTADLEDDCSAAGLLTAVLRILRDLFTPLSGVPRRAATAETTTDLEALGHVAGIVEVFNADAAADEQLAGRMLQGITGSGALGDGGGGAGGGAPAISASIFPNLKVVGKDKPHGARRITSRTWKCDPYLHKIAENVVMSRYSIAQLLQHSDVLRARCGKHVRDLHDNPVWSSKMSTLSAAKHRFDSWTKPFSRICLTFDAVVATAQEMHEERRNDAVGRHAKEFLKFVDEEVMLSLAMMSDAGEETLELVRFLDSTRVPTCDIASECQRFLERVTVLFEKGRCVQCGHTAYMRTALQKERLLFIDRKPKRVGGVAVAPIVTRCLKRFQTWVRLAREVLRAEFPQFETVQAFSALRLRSLAAEPLAALEAERLTQTAKLAKIAQMLNLDADELTIQLFDNLPSALWAFERGGVGDSLAAWREAVGARDQSCRRLGRRRASQTGVLRSALLRAGAWGASTSCVERLFGLLLKAQPKERNCMDEGFVRDELFLLASKQLGSPAGHKALSQAAPAVWASAYGPPREAARNETRRRRRRLGGRAPRPGTWKAWKQKRRAEVTRAVEEARGSGELAADAPAPLVDVHADTFDIAEEALFQRRKRFKRALDSMRENSLTPAEQIAEFGSVEGAQQVLAASTYLSKKSVGEHFRKSQRKKASRSRAEPAAAALRGKRVHVDSAVARAVGRRAALDEALGAVGAAAEPARETADAFLVPDVARPGQRVLLSAGLAGGIVLSLPSLITGVGPRVSYRRALETRRVVWFSETFQHSHPALMAIFRARLAEARQNRWAVAPEREDFCDRARRNARKIMFLGFAAKREVGGYALRVATVLTSETLMPFLTTVARLRSSTAACEGFQRR